MRQENIENIIQAMPKAELHLHLRGAIPLAYIRRQIEKYTPRGIKKDIPAWQKAVFLMLGATRPLVAGSRWTDEALLNLFNTRRFTTFLLSFYFTRYFMKDREDFQDLVDSVLLELKAQNITYAEITVTASDYEDRGIAFDDLLACLERASARRTVRVNWLVDVVRDAGKKGAMRTLEKVIAGRPSSVIGINLGGSEHLFPTRNYARVFERARQAGLRLTAHAGEAAGPRSVWDALLILGAERIGHGVRAIEDPALVRYLAEHRIPLEVCPTSNIFTHAYPSYREHPMKRLFDAGVPITINTDDPTFFRTRLAEEYLHAHAAGFSSGELLCVLANGFACSFLPDEEKRAFARQIQEKGAHDED